MAQQTIAGLANGGVYATLALALVLIHRATGVINFAQGEMGMFATYIAWSLIFTHGLTYWLAFFLTLLIAFLGGVGIYGVVIRPLQRGGQLTVVVATIALLVLLDGLAGWIWSPEVRAFKSPFPNDLVTVGDVVVSWQDLGTIGVSLACVALVFAFFRFTRMGLQMRAAALRPGTSRLLGIHVDLMLATGWGLAAALAAVAGMMAAPILPLEPSFMLTVLVYAFAAAVLGGIDSPVGAVVGSYALGVGISLLSTYVDFITDAPELELPVALGVLLLVLVVRPAGLFGRPVTRRV
ncbi:MAG: branched-chain amino acid ABC transporter permease [Chloroflexota bacterium]